MYPPDLPGAAKTMKILRETFNIVVVLLTAWLFSWSCDKNHISPENNDTIPDNDTIPEYHRSDYLVIGDTSNTLFINYDSLEIKAEVPSNISYELDIDLDGNNDIVFHISSGGGQSYSQSKVSIRSLDSTIMFSGFDTYDTLYYHSYIDTVYRDYVLIRFHNDHRYCERIDSSSTEKISEYYRVNQYKKGDTLHLSDFFKSNDIPLWYGVSTYSYPFYETLDTVKVIMGEFFHGCNNFPLDAVNLGFRQKVSDEIKLGWIKFKMESGSYITLYQTAIQK